LLLTLHHIHLLDCSSPVKPKHPNIKKYNNIKVLNINFQSIKNKKEELWNLVDTSDPDIIFGTETWLNNNITNSEIFTSDMNYDVVRKDQEDGYGGVLIAFKKNFIFEAITVKQNVECQFLKIQLSKSLFTEVFGNYIHIDFVDLF
jgi:exonuclease III